MSHSGTAGSSILATLISTALIACCIAAAGAVRAQAPSAASPSPTTSADTLEAQAARGQEAYANNCASCHASDLAGGEIGPPLFGRAFNRNWKDKSAKDLYVRIRDTMPQGAPNTLTPAAYMDIVALIIKTNEYSVSKAVTEENAGSVTLTQ